MATDDWTNNKPLDLRTIIGIRVLLLVFMIVRPYEFAHQFQDDIKELRELLVVNKEIMAIKEVKKK